jgi:hypothetical protein
VKGHTVFRTKIEGWLDGDRCVRTLFVLARSESPRFSRIVGERIEIFGSEMKEEYKLSRAQTINQS